MTDRPEDPRPVVLAPGKSDRRRAIPTRRPAGEVTGGSAAAPPPGGASGGAAEPPPEPPAATVEVLLAERTADLQRLQAEYDNYRKRVRRDRLAVGEVAVANVLGRLLPVLDALDGARRQDELTGGLRAVAELLETELGALGLESVGEAGDPFDPALHEAVARTPSLVVTAPTCVEILRVGYRVGGHLLRPAEVVVAEPARGGAPSITRRPHHR
ncbi:hypothetical protein GCM10010441_30220 [Kitasatospora paracochleata]|uniref:Protein GrpE n=1 Tax=Kitasatospora paracochleata TaxID=58354 RepID=A0ABT1IT93_9ACTN|nr:nucleotide exchange factor GrpE [Kitasatospora paracochleata]MCP2308337.1 molecular chaperone GrpE [Kitasatospora paracochleata]